MRALRYRDSYRREKGEPIAWLIGIARRVIAEHVTTAVEIPDPEPESIAAVQLEDAWLDSIDLRRAIEALGSRDRELISLRYGADLTARQIGELLEMQTNAVEVALHRALHRLRALIAEPGSDPEQSGGVERV